MKSFMIITIFVISCCIAPMVLAGNKAAVDVNKLENSKQVDAPKAVVVEKIFTFDEVLEGDMVTHAYNIENHGTALLKVLDVRTSCGCTTTQRPETIAPGAQGRIMVKAKTNGYGGRVFNKTITVSTNDPLQSTIQLQLSGPVAQFARIEPRYISLRGRMGEALQAEATIVPNSKYPFHISTTELDDQLAGKIDVDTYQRGGIYHIVAHNRVAAPGNYRGKIIFKTDSPVRPQLSLFIHGHIDR